MSAEVRDIAVGQVWRSRDKRDNGRTVTVEEWDGVRYGFVTVRSVRKSRIRALNLIKQYDLLTSLAPADDHRECGQPWAEHADDGVQMLCPDAAALVEKDGA
jgi:hypothetical protein